MTPEEDIGKLLTGKKLTISVAESCTGGLLSSMITNVPQCSAYFESSVVCYSKKSKTGLLGVPEELIDRYGTVSAETAGLMAEAVRKQRKTDIGLAVTGIAGPDTIENKETGRVFIAISSGKKVCAKDFRFNGSRVTIKKQASIAALTLLRSFLEA